jgi:hypothetical protein
MTHSETLLRAILRVYRTEKAASFNELDRTKRPGVNSPHTKRSWHPPQAVAAWKAVSRYGNGTYINC